MKWIYLLSLILCVSCTNSSQSLPGYIEGEYTYIASGVGGTLFNLAVSRGQTVKKAELLYQLDPQPQKAIVEASLAKIADLEAQVTYAKIQMDRQRLLMQRNAAPKSDFDLARSDYESKSGQLAATKAQLVESQWSLSQKTMHAPIEGMVFDTYFRVGEKVPENRPVLSLLNPGNIKVLFYIPETLLSKVKIGQSIRFFCDGCRGRTAAKISYISPEAEYTPPVIYSKDTRYKLVYLVRASLPKEVAVNFHPGQPIEVFL